MGRARCVAPRASPLIPKQHSPPCALLPAGRVCVVVICHGQLPASPFQRLPRTEHGKAPKAPVTGCTCTAVPTGQSPLAQGCLLSLPRIGWSTALHSLRKPCTVCSCQGHICLFSVLHHEKKKKKNEQCEIKAGFYMHTLFLVPYYTTHRPARYRQVFLTCKKLFRSW